MRGHVVGAASKAQADFAARAMFWMANRSHGLADMAVRAPVRLERRTLLVPRRRLLVGVRDLQQSFFTERFAQDLEADGKLRTGAEPAREADAANPRQVAGDGEDV